MLILSNRSMPSQIMIYYTCFFHQNTEQTLIYWRVLKTPQLGWKYDFALQSFTHSLELEKSFWNSLQSGNSASPPHYQKKFNAWMKRRSRAWGQECIVGQKAWSCWLKEIDVEDIPQLKNGAFSRLCLCTDSVTVSVATASLEPRWVIAHLWVKLKSHTAEKERRDTKKRTENISGGEPGGDFHTFQGAAGLSARNLPPNKVHIVDLMQCICILYVYIMEIVMQI